MNTHLKDEFETKPEAAKASPIQSLTGSQNDESGAIAEIMQRTIRKQGKFKDKLSDFAHAFARTENFDQPWAEIVIRGQFQAKFGQTMNDMRKDLMEREDNLTPAGREDALHYAHTIAACIQDGETMPFWRAFDDAGAALAVKLDITESGAKMLMKEVFLEVEQKDLYEYGKDVEKRFHTPVREAQRASRETERGAERGAERERAGPSR